MVPLIGSLPNSVMVTSVALSAVQERVVWSPAVMLCGFAVNVTEAAAVSVFDSCETPARTPAQLVLRMKAESIRNARKNCRTLFAFTTHTPGSAQLKASPQLPSGAAPHEF